MDTPAGLAQSGRGFHLAANQLRRRSEQLLASLPKGETTDKQSLQIVAELFGCSFGAMVLQALSLELMLKALRNKHSIKLLKSHDLEKLFLGLPSHEQEAAEGSYAAKIAAHNAQAGGVSLSGSLETLLRRSAKTFVEFRYLSDSRPSKAPIGEMQIAFEALDERATFTSRSCG